MGKWNVPLFIILVGSDWQLISHRNLLIQGFRFLFFVVFWTTSKSACPKSSQIDAFHFTKWMFSGSNNRSCPQNRMRKVFQGFPTPASSLTSLICCLLWVFFFKSTFVWVTFADNPTKHYPQKDRACPLATFPFSIIIILCHQCRETVDHHCRLKPITQSHDLRLSLLEKISFSVSFWKLNVERMWMWK